MEKSHIEQISRIAPEVRGKTMLFGHWIGMRDIPDPYQKVMKLLLQYMT
jgi:protein-tyrosine phosphatase